MKLGRSRASEDARSRWSFCIVAGAFALLSCQERPSATERPADTQAALGGSVAATVGGEPIPLSVVEAVAKAQNLAPRDAARRIIDDAIAANAARKRGLDQRGPASWSLTAARARILSDRLHEEAKKAGPPTDEEVARLSAAHWAEVDRPPMVEVIHVIARRPQKAELVPDAQKLGAALLAATKDAASVKDFEARAKAVPHAKDIEVRVERLPPFTEDGRVAGGSGMDSKFAGAAYALSTPGTTSGVVETSFGWHVIRLIDRTPERRMPLEDRRKAFAEEVLAMRGHDAVTVLLREISSTRTVEVSPSSETMMQSVSVANEQASNP